MAEAELNSKNNNPYVCYCDLLLWKIKLRKLCWSITNAAALKAPDAFHPERGQEQGAPPCLEHFHPSSPLHGLFVFPAILMFRKSLFFFF